MSDNDTVSNVLLGAAGGLAGMVAMRLYWVGAGALPGRDPRVRTMPPAPDPPMDEGEVKQQQRQRRENLSALEEAPDHWDGTLDERQRTRYRAPWSYGLAAGAAYGAWRGRAANDNAGSSDAAAGLLFGGALWAVADEGLSALIGAREGRAAQPWKQHLHRLGAHLAYGAATAAATQGLFRIAKRVERR